MAGKLKKSALRKYGLHHNFTLMVPYSISSTVFYIISVDKVVSVCKSLDLGVLCITINKDIMQLNTSNEATVTNKLRPTATTSIIEQHPKVALSTSPDEAT